MSLRVSIITVSYNSEATIARTIESVLSQTYNNIEYLIIDGASSDSTVEIASSYKDRFAARGVVYNIISERDNGIYDAMNKGIRLSQGELIGIINSDDWYNENAVAVAVSSYTNKPYDMFYADINIWEQQKSGEMKLKMVKHSRLRTPVVSRDWNHPTTFITSDTYKKIGLYKLESVHDDWDLVLRIRKAGLRISVVNEVLANFTIGGVSNAKSLKNCLQRGKARYHIYRANGYSRLYWFECVLIEAVKFVLT